MVVVRTAGSAEISVDLLLTATIIASDTGSIRITSSWNSTIVFQPWHESVSVVVPLENLSGTTQRISLALSPAMNSEGVRTRLSLGESDTMAMVNFESIPNSKK